MYYSTVICTVQVAGVSGQTEGVPEQHGGPAGGGKLLLLRLNVNVAIITIISSKQARVHNKKNPTSGDTIKSEVCICRQLFFHHAW